MVRYSLLRILIFFGVMSALWLLGLRDRDQQILLLVLSALISMAISVVVLRRFREDYSQQLAERLERRAQAKQQRGDVDEQAEDAEDESRDNGPVEYR
jgi:membrane protein implicated in regulation of membrane protease activity